MSRFSDWCQVTEQTVNGHMVRAFCASAPDVPVGIDAVAGTIPDHYWAPERMAHLLRRLGKPAAAKLAAQKLPRGKSIRSGEMGEILGMNYVTESMAFVVVNRLRWKDHREMAMRGDDILGVRAGSGGEVAFLKGEAKSRQSLTATVVSEARAALAADNERPSPHAIMFVAERLHEAGDEDLANLVDDAVLVRQIKEHNVTHLVFVVSGNDPQKLLVDDVTAYGGRVAQEAIGLQIPNHQDFIRLVFERALADAER